MSEEIDFEFNISGRQFSATRIVTKTKGGLKQKIYYKGTILNDTTVYDKSNKSTMQNFDELLILEHEKITE